METVQDPCAHCGNAILSNQLVLAKEERFCCQGCRIVRENLLANGLEAFYDLRNIPLEPVGGRLTKSARFGYLDDTEFQNSKFEKKRSGEKEETLVVRFYIEGARCQACLWILERIPDRLGFVRSSRFSLDKSILEVEVDSQNGKLSDIPALITSYGYTPHLIFEDGKARELKKKEKRSELTRVGVAFACAGNIMLLSASVYAGLDGKLKEWFDAASFLLCLPVISYCSVPFYRSTWTALRSNRFSIDVSVSLGIVFGFVISAWHVFTGRGDVYFDTIAMLVFLLLGSRFLLDAARDRGLDSSEVRSFFSNISAKKILASGEVKEVHTSLLAAGDLIQIGRGEMVPADAVIENGESYLNESSLTGESFPARRGVGDQIYGGCENQSEELVARVSCRPEESKMGKILARLQSNWGKQTYLARLSDQFSKKLVLCVSILAAGVFFYFYAQGKTDVGLQRALAMIIITCPCALGFNIPISMMIGMKKFAKNGIILKDDNVVEKVAKVRNVFLDKTGTVTSGQREIKLTWTGHPEPEVLYALEERSKHPLAEPIKKVLLELHGKVGSVDIKDFQEIPGKGPCGWLGEHQYSIAPLKEGGKFALYKKLKDKNQKVILTGEVQDELDASFASTVAQLKSLGKTVFMLSGDAQERVVTAAKACGENIQESFWGAEPGEKERIISEHPNSLMLGDGVNDALALKSADVGVAASGGVDLALSSSNVYFCSSSLGLLLKLFIGCDQLIGIVKANVYLALVYNLIFIALALVGMITPLAAAVLMPISSLTLLGVSLVLLSRLDRSMGK